LIGGRAFMLRKISVEEQRELIPDDVVKEAAAAK
jgi:hypothetical protein